MKVKELVDKIKSGEPTGGYGEMIIEFVRSHPDEVFTARDIATALNVRQGTVNCLVSNMRKQNVLAGVRVPGVLVGRSRGSMYIMGTESAVVMLRDAIEESKHGRNHKVHSVRKGQGT